MRSLVVLEGSCHAHSSPLPFLRSSRTSGVENAIAAAAANARRRKNVLMSQQAQANGKKLIPTVFKFTGELLYCNTVLRPQVLFIQNTS